MRRRTFRRGWYAAASMALAMACSSSEPSGLVNSPGRDQGAAGGEDGSALDSGSDASFGLDEGVLVDQGALDAGDADLGPTDNGAMDASVPFGCNSADRSGAQGDACGCPDDCSEASPLCIRNLVVDPVASNYCTVGCGDGAICSDGFECFDAFGLVEPFCQRCAEEVPGTGALADPCICERDCGTVEVGGSERALSCRGSECTVVGCVPGTSFGCPEGRVCEIRGIEPICVACEVGDGSRLESESCGCERDCAEGLQCFDGACGRPCTGDDDCAVDQSCRQELLGPARCAPRPAGCADSGMGALGDLCSCSADCAAEAPVCLSQSLTSSIAVGFCTVRPCDRAGPDPCGSQDFRCCEVPLLFPATCLQRPLADGLDGLLDCSP